MQSGVGCSDGFRDAPGSVGHISYSGFPQQQRQLRQQQQQKLQQQQQLLLQQQLQPVIHSNPLYAIDDVVIRTSTPPHSAAAVSTAAAAVAAATATGGRGGVGLQHCGAVDTRPSTGGGGGLIGPHGRFVQVCAHHGPLAPGYDYRGAGGAGVGVGVGRSRRNLDRSSAAVAAAAAAKYYTTGRTYGNGGVRGSYPQSGEYVSGGGGSPDLSPASAAVADYFYWKRMADGRHFHGGVAGGGPTDSGAAGGGGGGVDAVDRARWIATAVKQQRAAGAGCSPAGAVVANGNIGRYSRSATSLLLTMHQDSQNGNDLTALRDFDSQRRRGDDFGHQRHVAVHASHEY